MLTVFCEVLMYSIIYRVQKGLGKRLDVISEDFRKLTVNAISVGIIAFIVQQDKISSGESLKIIALALVWWTLGIILSKINDED